MQCHLETTSGRIPAVIKRFNRGPFSFMPGEPLEDFALFFDHAPGTGHDDKFEAVSSVYRLRQSKCFAESEGKLTCQTCHNPHRVPRGEEAVEPLFRHLPAVPCHPARLDRSARFPDLVRQAPGRGRLRHLPHAEAARRGYSAHDHDRPSDPAASARGKPACRIAGAPARGLPRRGRALLSFAPSRKRTRTRCTAPWRRWGWETMSRPACRNWRARSKSRSPARPSSTSCSAMPGRAPENHERPLPPMSRRFDWVRIR